MIRNKFIINILVLVAAIGIWSCTARFEETNKDPNEPTSVPAEYLLTSAQKFLMDVVWDEWANGRFGLVYSQYWAQNAYPAESRYQLREGVNNNYWSYYYTGRDVTVDGTINGGGIMDLVEIIKLNTEVDLGDKSQNQIAVARILKVWMFQILTDIYGAIPYSQAFQGKDNPSPAYDNQQDIYRDLLNELSEASDQIVVDAESFASGDAIYGGDMTLWKKFANSLRLRVAMRVSDVLPEEASTHINDAIEDGVFESNTDDALFPYLNSSPNNNPLHEDHKTREDFAVSNTLVDLMNELGDPRLPLYADTVKSNEIHGYVGMVYGLEDNTANNIPVDVISQPSGASAHYDSQIPFKPTDVYAPTAPGILMTYVEVLFIMAEAAERGYIAGDVASLYSQAIAASMNAWGVDAQASSDYLAQDNVDYNTLLNSMTWKEIIGRQKWLAMYMQGHQGWIEWRRLDFGILQLPADGILVEGLSEIPTRRTYPVDEQTLNRVNYEDAVPAILGGPDKMDTKVWWDVN